MRDSRTGGSHRWFTQMVHTDGSHRWFTQMVHTDGSHRWFTQMVHTDGSHRWFTQMVHIDGSHKWFTQVVHTNGSQRKAAQQRDAARATETTSSTAAYAGISDSRVFLSSNAPKQHSSETQHTQLRRQAALQPMQG